MDTLAAAYAESVTHAFSGKAHGMGSACADLP